MADLLRTLTGCDVVTAENLVRVAKPFENKPSLAVFWKKQGNANVLLVKKTTDIILPPNHKVFPTFDDANDNIDIWKAAEQGPDTFQGVVHTLVASEPFGPLNNNQLYFISTAEKEGMLIHKIDGDRIVQHWQNNHDWKCKLLTDIKPDNDAEVFSDEATAMVVDSEQQPSSNPTPHPANTDNTPRLSTPKMRLYGIDGYNEGPEIPRNAKSIFRFDGNICLERYSTYLARTTGAECTMHSMPWKVHPKADEKIMQDLFSSSDPMVDSDYNVIAWFFWGKRPNCTVVLELKAELMALVRNKRMLITQEYKQKNPRVPDLCEEDLSDPIICTWTTYQKAGGGLDRDDVQKLAKATTKGGEWLAEHTQKKSKGQTESQKEYQFESRMEETDRRLEMVTKLLQGLAMTLEGFSQRLDRI
jgi:hypothetical protein